MIGKAKAMEEDQDKDSKDPTGNSLVKIKDTTDLEEDVLDEITLDEGKTFNLTNQIIHAFLSNI